MHTLLWQAAVSGGFNPLALGPSLLLDFKSGGFTTEAGDRITQWDDRSGNGNHATAASGSAARPTLGANGVEFDGTNWLLSSPLTQTQPTTVVLVSAGSTTGYIFSETTGSAGGLYLAISDVYSVGSPNVVVPETHADPFILMRVNTGTQTIIRMTGTEYPPEDQVIPSFSGVCLGKRYALDNNYVTTTLMHASIFPAALSAPQRQEMERWLANRYGVSL